MIENRIIIILALRKILDYMRHTLKKMSFEKIGETLHLINEINLYILDDEINDANINHAEKCYRDIQIIMLNAGTFLPSFDKIKCDVKNDYQTLLRSQLKKVEEI